MGFNDIAKKKTPASKTTIKVAAQVTDDIKDQVDIVITTKAQIKAATAELAAAETEIINHVKPQYAELARSGNFTKSLNVEGNEGDVLFVASDKFSAPKENESVEALQKLLGKKYGTFFSDERTITVKKDVIKDRAKIAQIEEVFNKAGLDVGDFFDVFDTLKANKGLDVKQFELTEKKLEVFQTLAPQAKPALKC